jgi:hypothetical protein
MTTAPALVRSLLRSWRPAQRTLLVLLVALMAGVAVVLLMLSGNGDPTGVGPAPVPPAAPDLPCPGGPPNAVC